MNQSNKSTHKLGPFIHGLGGTVGGLETWDIYEADEEYPMASFGFWSEEQGKRAEAIARLFAASPELLDALELADRCLEFYAGQGYTNSADCRSIRSAIAAARGSVQTPAVAET